MKTFSIVSLISMALTLTVAVLGLIGIAFTGFYPGIIVLCLLAMVPIASKWFAKKRMAKPNDFQGNYYTTLTLINLLIILVVLWMTFVIVHDRVLQDCC
jgi:cytochrome b561